MSESKNEAFLRLYTPSHERLGRFVATLVWDREEAKDIVSETLLLALDNFHKLKSEGAFLHFLFGIAINLIRKRKRRSWRSVLFGDQDWDQLNEQVHAENNSDTTDLYTLLNLLGEKSREAIVLFEISGFSIREISKMQNSSETAVKSRLSRARKTLQQACESEENQVHFNSI